MRRSIKSKGDSKSYPNPGKFGKKQLQVATYSKYARESGRRPAVFNGIEQVETLTTWQGFILFINFNGIAQVETPRQEFFSFFTYVMNDVPSGG